jgi:DNA polymerase-3 subunit epsilon
MSHPVGTVTSTWRTTLAYAPLNERPLAFIDTETTGLVAAVHEIIEVAIIREMPDGTLEEWAVKVKPQNLEVAEPIALRINGYNDHPELWADAPTFDEIAPIVAAKLEGCILVGHNVSFDLAFLNDALKRAGSKAKLPYHKIDTVTLAFEHLVPKGLTSLSLDNIRKFLGWSKDGAHTALVDARDCRTLYRHCLKLE